VGRAVSLPIQLFCWYTVDYNLTACAASSGASNHFFDKMPSPGQCALIVLERPFTLTEQPAVEQSFAVGRKRRRDRGMKHLVKGNVAHEIFGHISAIERRMDANQAVRPVIRAKGDLALSAGRPRAVAPGDACRTPTIEIAPVELIVDRLEIVDFSLGLNLQGARRVVRPLVPDGALLFGEGTNDAARLVLIAVNQCGDRPNDFGRSIEKRLVKTDVNGVASRHSLAGEVGPPVAMELYGQ